MSEYQYYESWRWTDPSTNASSRAARAVHEGAHHPHELRQHLPAGQLPGGRHVAPTHYRGARYSGERPISRSLSVQRWVKSSSPRSDTVATSMRTAGVPPCVAVGLCLLSDGPDPGEAG
jgi:hypothetical protein